MHCDRSWESMLIFYHGCWLAIFGHLAQEIQKSTMTLTTFLNSCTPQMMEEIFNQLPGTTVPVTVLVQTLAEFATLYGMCSPLWTWGLWAAILDKSNSDVETTSVFESYVPLADRNPHPFFLLEDKNPFFLHLHVSFLCSYSIYSYWYHCFFGGWLKNKALQFAPRLKNVLSRALPILGGVKDSQRSIYANGSSLLQISFIISVWWSICHLSHFSPVILSPQCMHPFVVCAIQGSKFLDRNIWLLCSYHILVRSYISISRSNTITFSSWWGHAVRRAATSSFAKILWNFITHGTWVSRYGHFSIVWDT